MKHKHKIFYPSGLKSLDYSQILQINYSSQSEAWEKILSLNIRQRYMWLESKKTIFGIIGLLFLFVSLILSKFALPKFRKISYILAVIGTISLLLFYGLSFTKDELKNLTFLSSLASSLGLISWTFYELFSTTRKQIRKSLYFLGFFFFSIGVVLQICQKLEL